MSIADKVLTSGRVSVDRVRNNIYSFIFSGEYKKRFYVYSINGVLLFSGIISSADTVDLSFLSVGIFMLKIDDMEKFIEISL
ncbi:MAG: hypothetical protein N4A72_00395 [Bacteroidales bacterium]|jgi:hypothetical protein|nr:hypothetical protein [Bacteroidales bacterium]